MQAPPLPWWRGKGGGSERNYARTGTDIGTSTPLPEAPTDDAVV